MQYVSPRTNNIKDQSNDEVLGFGGNPIKKIIEKQLKAHTMGEDEPVIEDLKIKFWCDVDLETCEELIKCIGKAEDTLWKLHLRYKIPFENLPPIELYINSPGGDLTSGLAVINRIQSSQFKFKSIVEGIAASCGSLIAVVCDERVMYEDSTILIHELRASFFKTKFEAMKQELILCEKIMNSIMKIYMENTKMTAQTIKSMLKKDIIWYADECLDLGLIDSIIPRIKQPKRKLRTKHYKISKKELELGALKARGKRESAGDKNLFSNLLGAMMQQGQQDDESEESEKEDKKPTKKKRTEPKAKK